MTVVRVACVPRPICVVVSLLLLLVLLLIEKGLVSLFLPHTTFINIKKMIFSLLCLPYPLAPLLLRTPFLGREFGSLQKHWIEHLVQCQTLHF